MKMKKNIINKDKKYLWHPFTQIQGSNDPIIIENAKGEKLYDIFFDKTHRLYSCAYWKNDTKTLEEAQQNKINHIIKKLDIKEGQKVLEVGCGWGGMAFEIAKQRKCEVTGISLSKNQIEYCKRKANELNLDNQVKFELMDYREAKGKLDFVQLFINENLLKK